MIALECCAGFCCITIWISFMSTSIPSLPLHPTPPGHHRTSSWASYAIRLLSTNYLFCIQYCILTPCNCTDCSLPGFSGSGISRQEYWSGLPCPPPGIFLAHGLNPSLSSLLHWPAGNLPLVPPGYVYGALLVAQTVKNLPAVQETRVWSLGGKDPWRRE